MFGREESRFHTSSQSHPRLRPDAFFLGRLLTSWEFVPVGVNQVNRRIVTVLLGAILTLPMANASFSTWEDALPSAGIIGTKPTRAFVLSFETPDAPILVLFPQPGWTARVDSEGERHTLRLFNSGGEVVGELTTTYPGHPVLTIEEREQLQYDASTRVNTPVGSNTPPVESGGSLAVPMETSIGYCDAYQTCVFTSVNEGCSDCVKHWGKIQSPASKWYYFDACDVNHGCWNVYSIYQPGTYWESGWVCQPHEYLWWNVGANAFTRIHSGGTVNAEDRGITYWDDKGC